MSAADTDLVAIRVEVNALETTLRTLPDAGVGAPEDAATAGIPATTPKGLAARG